MNRKLVMRAFFLVFLFGFIGSGFAREWPKAYVYEGELNFVFGGPNWDRIIIAPFNVPEPCPKDLTLERYTELAENEAERMGLKVTNTDYTAMMNIQFQCAGKAVYMQVTFSPVIAYQQLRTPLNFGLASILYDNKTSFMDSDLSETIADAFEYYVQKNTEE